jgi:outer membrane protein OmpA-like peptidoglycan-associated protein/tetratricopeptide (TPR) repeat protein
MNRTLTSFISFSLLLILNSCLAQPHREYSIKNKRAIAKYEEAITAYGQYNSSLALIILEDLVDNEDEFAEAYFLLGQIYTEKNDKIKAVSALEKGLAINASIFPMGYYMLGESYFSLAEYAKAEQAITKYIKIPKANLNLKTRSELILESCVFAQESMKYPVPFNPLNLGPQINTENDEYFPCITADTKTLLFTRLLKDKQAFEGLHEDFFVSERKEAKNFNEGWELSKPIPSINTLYNEGAPTLSADGQTIVFTACELPGYEYGETRTGLGSCDLFYSFRKKNGWTPSENFGAGINSSNWETQPSLTADGSKLFFVRGKKVKGGKIENQNIYYSQLNNEGYWSEPTEIPGLVNTPGREESVFVHPDGQTLYFSSDGHPGMGGLDIFVSHLQSNGDWSMPVNLGYPINTSANENSIQVTAQGDVALMASNRKGGNGGLDLYSFELPETVRPRFVSYVEGYVYDSNTKEPLDGKFQLMNLKSGEIVAEGYSNSSRNGYYLVCLPIGNDYALNVTSENYLFYSSNFSLINSTDTKPFRKDAPLQQMNAGATIVLENIFFKTNSANLESESFIELTKLTELLVKNEKLRIRIEGHTDSDGDEAANLKLSQARALSVKTYLESKGIVATRIESEGYGESQPIESNATPEGKAKNRRTVFRVL